MKKPSREAVKNTTAVVLISIAVLSLAASSFPAIELFKQAENDFAEFFLMLWILVAGAASFVVMFLLCFMIYVAPILIGQVICYVWEWLWKPRGETPGAEVKVVPYSSERKRNA